VAVKKALEDAKIGLKDIRTVECHDCFTITGILSVEAIGFAKAGEGSAFVCGGNTSRDGVTPFNSSGGLIGWGHPTGATGVRQAVTVWQQLTKKAGDKQIPLVGDRPYALSVNMGGDDRISVAIVYRSCRPKDF
jgi:acetyl-CoA C-acetyltransferase/acetyl-CoA acyltransferase